MRTLMLDGPGGGAAQGLQAAVSHHSGRHDALPVRLLLPHRLPEITLLLPGHTLSLFFLILFFSTLECLGARTRKKEVVCVCVRVCPSPLDGWGAVSSRSRTPCHLLCSSTCATHVLVCAALVLRQHLHQLRHQLPQVGSCTCAHLCQRSRRLRVAVCVFGVCLGVCW